VANDPGGEGKGQMGGERLRSVALGPIAARFWSPQNRLRGNRTLNTPSRSRQSRTGVSAPYLAAISAGSGST
jgi:hypothetical protein